MTRVTSDIDYTYYKLERNVKSVYMYVCVISLTIIFLLKFRFTVL